MRKVLVCLVCIGALALVPATASANTYKLKGEITGVSSSGVTVKVKKTKGRIGRIESLKFQRVPVTCDGGSSGAISATFPQFPVRGKDFTRKTKIQGVGINDGFVKVNGKFRRHGKAVKGFVRFAFKSTGGQGCGTDSVRWKASK